MSDSELAETSIATNHSQQIVQKPWNYCSVLLDDGLSHGEYIEPLTHLLFLKMADEQTRPPNNRPSAIAAEIVEDLSAAPAEFSEIQADLEAITR